MFKNKKNDRESQLKKIERIKNYYISLNEDEEKVRKYVREKIVEWLSQSDKTRHQLQEKIYKNIKKDHEQLVEESLDYFEEIGYIKEDRFVECFIRMKYNQYAGKTKILMELKSKGVKTGDYDYMFDEYDFEFSADEYIKKKTDNKEFSQKEIDKLKNKMISKGFNFQEISIPISEVKRKKVIFETNEEGLDLTEAIKIIEKQLRKGYGLKKIKQELRQKGVEHTEEIFDDFDFYEAARNYKIKKYGEDKETDFKIINKQKTHMLSRGFNFDEIAEAMA